MDIYRYKKSKYGGSDEQMKKLTTLMTAYGASAGINVKFGGKIANTIDAHRLIQLIRKRWGQRLQIRLLIVCDLSLEMQTPGVIERGKNKSSLMVV